MDLYLVNDSGIPEDIYWLLIGQNADGAVCWVDAAGVMHPVQVGDDCDTYQSVLGKETCIPGLSTIASARVAFTIGQPLQISIVTDGNGNPNVQDAVFWDPSDPNYDFVWDKVEFSLVGGQVWANSTQVDFFGIPTVVKVTDGTTTLESAPLAISRDRLFAKFAADPVFGQCVVHDGDVGVRVIAPGYMPGFPSTYFDGYIDASWEALKKAPITLSLAGAPAGYTSATGIVRGTRLDLVDNLGGNYTIHKPTSFDVFLCNGAFDIDTKLSPVRQQVDGILKRQVGAALNRGVLTAVSGDYCVVGDFYQTNPTNGYSRILHESYVDGRAYGFAYDDVCNKYSSTMSIPGATRTTIIIESLLERC